VRRLALGALGLLLLGTVLFGANFLFSRYAKGNAPIGDKWSDYLFMVGSYGAAFTGRPAPPYDSHRLERALHHARKAAHHEVRKRAVVEMVRLGTEAAPALIREIGEGTDLGRIGAAAQALVDLRYPEAVARIAPRLEWALANRRSGSLPWNLFDALGESGDAAAIPHLVGALEQHPERSNRAIHALGLLKATPQLGVLLAAAKDDKARSSIVWALARADTPEAARLAAPLFLHRSHQVRMSAYSAFSQYPGLAMVDPFLEMLSQAGDFDQLRGTVYHHVFARRQLAGHAGLVEHLAAHLDDPAVAWAARHALGRIGSDQSVAALHRWAGTDRHRVHEILSELQWVGAAAWPVILDALRSPSATVRRRALDAVRDGLDPDLRPLVLPLRHDPDPWMRRSARDALFALDQMELFRSFTQLLPPSFGKVAWVEYRKDLRWGSNRGDEVLNVLRVIHFLGIAVTILIALLLLLFKPRLVERFRFHVLVAFLLSAGFVGDFLLLGNVGGVEAETAFTRATGARLLLLVAILFQERDRLPDEPQGRVDRLGGASVPLLVPSLLLLGTPLLAMGLREGFHDFKRGFLPVMALAITSGLVVFEQWILPFHLFPRSRKVERLLSLLFFGALTVVVLLALGWGTEARTRMGDPHAPGLALLLAVPFAGALLMFASTARLWGGHPRTALPPSPSPRFEVHCDSDGVRVWIRAVRGRVWAWVVGTFQTLVIAGAGLGSAIGAGLASSGAAGLVLALVAGFLGAGMGGLLLAAFSRVPLIEIREGYLRCSRPWFGIAGRTAAWSRRLLCPVELTDEERSWLLQVTKGTAPTPARAEMGVAA
jgi:HEAT repeat protein